MTSLAEKSKGLLEVGEHCAECNKIDFLPFKCYDCDKTFCGDHRSSQSHDCQPKKSSSLGVSVPRPKSKSPSPASSRSRQSTPIRETLASAASNRAPSAIVNTKTTTTTTKTTTTTSTPPALERLKALWAKKNASSSSSSKPKKVNPLLALAELKRTAKGDDKIPTHERVYFYLVRPASEYTDTTGKITTRPEKKLPVYFNKDLVVGRALDKACELLSISNKNNTATDHKIGLYNGNLFVPYNQKLVDNIKDGAIVTVR